MRERHTHGPRRRHAKEDLNLEADDSLAATNKCAPSEKNESQITAHCEAWDKKSYSHTMLHTNLTICFKSVLSYLRYESNSANMAGLQA